MVCLAKIRFLEEILNLFVYKSVINQRCGNIGKYKQIDDCFQLIRTMEDEDDRRFAYRRMMQAHKMLRPSQPKRNMNERR